ncbi:pyridoxamine 5'-phosphate oxidase family protein [Rhizobium grahamii]|uniref:Pyridoxamine 5'-phosphate oxidase family protein n=1 Tax=Rhizobium grahamii TaxID=1120045 RepID=A0A5Q0CA75_9HYPH|nr:MULTISPECIES: pyridoxamine 5'-phosphate oxidase family protein [Rhizobium]QFY61314.1 pyridoxamine 5'-phosphate oxidase family protein [Rhizobium grahamii]QRM49536.1 pyridoxamine 5'-phosphate oxidase family protein [Rhizobium sp. BG6]
MDDFHTKRMLVEFLRKHNLAVIATCHRNGKPEAATIDFSVRDNLEVVFSTFEETRKFDNLAERPGVAFVVGWNDNITVQYEGEATRVSAADIEQYQEAYLNSLPAAREFIERGAVMFKATPRWIRYSDFNQEPPELIEIQF